MTNDRAMDPFEWLAVLFLLIGAGFLWLSDRLFGARP